MSISLWGIILMGKSIKRKLKKILVLLNLATCYSKSFHHDFFKIKFSTGKLLIFTLDFPFFLYIKFTIAKL